MWDNGRFLFILFGGGDVAHQLYSRVIPISAFRNHAWWAQRTRVCQYHARDWNCVSPVQGRCITRYIIFCRQWQLFNRKHVNCMLFYLTIYLLMELVNYMKTIPNGEEVVTNWEQNYLWEVFIWVNRRAEFRHHAIIFNVQIELRMAESITGWLQIWVNINVQRNLDTLKC